MKNSGSQTLFWKKLLRMNRPFSLFCMERKQSPISAKRELTSPYINYFMGVAEGNGGERGKRLTTNNLPLMKNSGSWKPFSEKLLRMNRPFSLFCMERKQGPISAKGGLNSDNDLCK